jgi:threonine/homoserine/homoserine lactone efflux protein
VLPGFVTPGADALSATVTLTVIYVMVATLIHAGIVTLAGAARGLLYDPARERVVRRVLAVALALVAVWFAIASQADLPA